MSASDIGSGPSVGTLLPGLVNAGLVVLLGLLAAELTWQLWPTESTTPLATAPAARTGAIARPPAASPGSVAASRHLFGEYQREKSAATPPPDPAEAPDTRLNLKLLGVLAATPDEGALAIVSDGRNQEEVYAVGDTLPGDAELAQVLPDRILLRRGDRLETLRLPEVSANLGQTPARSATRAGPGIVAPTTLSDGTSVRELRDEIVRNPLSFARRVATIPVREDGKLVGYRLRARDGSNTLEELGVRPDDVVTEVNGFRLDTRRGGMQALRDLRTAEQINLTLRRDGSEIPLSLSLQ